MRTTAWRTTTILLLDDGKNCALIAEFYIWTTTPSATGASTTSPVIWNGSQSLAGKAGLWRTLY